VHVDRMRKQNQFRVWANSPTDEEWMAQLRAAGGCPGCDGAGTRCYRIGPGVLVHRDCDTCGGTGNVPE